MLDGVHRLNTQSTFYLKPISEWGLILEST